MSILSRKVETFVDAWKQHDTAAMRISTAADVAKQNGRRYFTPAFALEKETKIMGDALNGVCDELNISTTSFMSCLQELRRDGVDHAKAVRLIVEYVGRINDAA